MSDRDLKPAAVEAGKVLLRYLRAHPTGSTLKDLVAAMARAGLKHCSVATARRGLNYLRFYQDAPIRSFDGDHTWVLEDPDFSLPLVDPNEHDLASAIFAAAVLQPLAPEKTRVRLERVVEMMDALIRTEGSSQLQQRRSMTASITSGMPASPEVVARLAKACGDGTVLELVYYSPWHDERKRHEVEPWQLRVHDGAMYLRAYSRSAEAPRTFKVIQIEQALMVAATSAAATRPPADEIWGSHDGIGMDDDRPNTAVVRIGGPYARWIGKERWHPSQEDTWSSDGTVLERRVEYRSCREFARRLLSLGDALMDVSPTELCTEVTSHAQAISQRLGNRGRLLT